MLFYTMRVHHNFKVHISLLLLFFTPSELNYTFSLQADFPQLFCEKALDVLGLGFLQLQEWVENRKR